MIVFDLACGNGHVFEAWFSDSAGFESQRAAGDVVCPVCSDSKVEKSLMAPAVPAKGAATAKDVETAQAATDVLQTLHHMRQQVEENCDNVGEDFAEEARKIHYGETEKRNIYGKATQEEAAELVEEDIEFGVLPWADDEEEPDDLN
jgi:hypothetical protein